MQVLYITQSIYLRMLNFQLLRYESDMVTSDEAMYNIYIKQLRLHRSYSYCMYTHTRARAPICLIGYECSKTMILEKLHLQHSPVTCSETINCHHLYASIYATFIYLRFFTPRLINKFYISYDNIMNLYPTLF